jgi:hypothetical protein
MRLVSEIIEERSKILLISPHKYLFINLIKNSLEKLGSDFFYSPSVLSSTASFEYLIFIDYEKSLKTLEFKNKKIILIYLNNYELATKNSNFLTKNRIANIKIVNLSEGKISEKEIERIIWFIFSTDKEIFLHIQLFQDIQKPKKNGHRQKIINTFLQQNKGRILKYLFILIVIFYLMVIPFQIISLYFTYKSSILFKQEKLNDAKIFLTFSNGNLALTKTLYKITRPAYLLFSLAMFPDNLLEINEISNYSLEKAIHISENGISFLSDVVKTNKTEDELRSQLLRFNTIASNLDSLQKNLKQLYQKVPGSPKFLQKIKQSISEQIDMLADAKTVFPLLKNILGVNGPKKYLLLFANNMELRPGGGFIGSYGIITANKLTLENIEIFDVYDADGQLKTHIDPPLPIRKYLNQPNWYLRDSAFSFDFSDNYSQAKMFLNEELNIDDFSGGIIITTTGIQNILESLKEIYLPDYDEKINKDNFYIKTQLYSEKDFFPGSIEKKSFLGSLARQILLNLNSASFPVMLKNLNKSLDEKQIIVIFEDKKIQDVFNSKYWSGKTILPVCLYEISNCVVDYVFPVDANLGVNKSNFFVTKTHKLNIKISKNGEITSELIIKIRNDSQNDIFPGGTYKNYFQLALSPRSLIDKTTVDDTLVETYDLKTDIYKTIGFLVEIKPQKSREIKINYKLQQPLEKGEGIYQLIFQKQIGSKNSDLSLSIKIPENTNIETQNFSPVVKENLIIYNTTLTGDKIFILKFKNK